MADDDNTNTRSMTADDRGVAIGRGGFVEFWKPLMWTAIVGGAVAALGLQIIFTLLGVGLGAAMTDANDPDTTGLGIGAVIWLVLSGVISFGVGGWVAGYASGVLRTGSGAMHGVASWALAAVFGATVTALAGSPVLGGAAAGIAPMADRAVGGDTVRFESGGTREDGRVVLPDGREMTEAEARQAAEDAREGVAKASLATGLAFLLSLVAAGVGGTLGRRSPEQIMRDEREHPTGRVRPAL